MEASHNPTLDLVEIETEDERSLKACRAAIAMGAEPSLSGSPVASDMDALNYPKQTLLKFASLLASLKRLQRDIALPFMPYGQFVIAKHGSTFHSLTPSAVAALSKASSAQEAFLHKNRATRDCRI